MTIIFGIIAIISILFGVCQLMGGYAIASGIGAIAFGGVVALQEGFEIIHVLPIV